MASNIGDPQYLALKALWVIKRRAVFKPHDWGIHGIDEAQQLLKSLPRWNDYLKIVPMKTFLHEILSITSHLGDFKLIWYYQQLIRWAKSTEDSDKNIEFSPPIAKRTIDRSGMPSYRECPEETPSRSTGSNVPLTERFMNVDLRDPPKLRKGNRLEKQTLQVLVVHHSVSWNLLRMTWRKTQPKQTQNRKNSRGFLVYRIKMPQIHPLSVFQTP